MKKSTANIITLLSLFCAFYAINETYNEHYIGAIYLIILAFLFDGLDGKVARMLHSATEFGKELDSLVDAISFGVAPAMLMFIYLHLYNYQFGFILPCFYIMCAVLRLARFNITPSNISKKYFIGLPVPAAALAVISMIFIDINNIHIKMFQIYVIIITVIISFLMVSKIYYFSFKNIESFIKRRAIVILPFLFLLLVLSIKEPLILFVLVSIYIASGPARSAVVRLAHYYS
jgi:CDP-diacylglycerol--serine O-phosphatidyltransferase